MPSPLTFSLFPGIVSPVISDAITAQLFVAGDGHKAYHLSTGAVVAVNHECRLMEREERDACTWLPGGQILLDRQADSDIGGTCHYIPETCHLAAVTFPGMPAIVIGCSVVMRSSTRFPNQLGTLERILPNSGNGKIFRIQFLARDADQPQYDLCSREKFTLVE